MSPIRSRGCVVADATWLVGGGLALLYFRSRGLVGSSVEAGDLLHATRSELESAAMKAALRQGADATVFLSIIDTENKGWNSQAVNMGPGDKARGGAYGLPQITERTALAVDDRIRTPWAELCREAGYNERKPWVLLSHPEVCLELGAAYVAECTRAGETVEDVAARYNSGRNVWNAPTVTLFEYVPRFMRNYKRRKGES